MPATYADFEQQLRRNGDMRRVYIQPGAGYWSVSGARRGYMIEGRLRQRGAGTVVTSARVVCVLVSLDIGLSRVRRRFIRNDPVGTVRTVAGSRDARVKDLVELWRNLRELPNVLLPWLNTRTGYVAGQPVSSSLVRRPIARKALDNISADLLEKGVWDARILADVLVDLISVHGSAIDDLRLPRTALFAEVYNALMSMLDVCYAVNRQVVETDFKPVERLLSVFSGR